MDSSINSSTTLASTISIDDEIVVFNRATFLSTYIRYQQCSLPDSIIYYISKNPSSAKVYGKLIQCCKYFLVQNPPIIVHDLDITKQESKLNVFFDDESVEMNTIPSKIFLTDTLYMSPVMEQNDLSVVIPKIFLSNIQKLHLRRQMCSINDLKFLGSKCEIVELIDSLVMDENEAVVAVEDVFSLFPRVKDFKFDYDVTSSKLFSSKTATELIKSPQFSKLQCLELFNIPETFDLDVFWAYMKKNKKTKIYLGFWNGLSVEYSNRLQNIVNEILDAASFDFKPPFLDFVGLDEFNFDLMMDLYEPN